MQLQSFADDGTPRFASYLPNAAAGTPGRVARVVSRSAAGQRKDALDVDQAALHDPLRSLIFRASRRERGHATGRTSYAAASRADVVLCAAAVSCPATLPVLGRYLQQTVLAGRGLACIRRHDVDCMPHCTTAPRRTRACAELGSRRRGEVLPSPAVVVTAACLKCRSWYRSCCSTSGLSKPGRAAPSAGARRGPFALLPLDRARRSQSRGRT
ncbi:hypothetical protein BV20DRAFT_672741 [Pilatotrama ljubarskyi]|nr:hypothetical protein BV20DRAFT_672741 [Pilatotrama ljubarskyi]